MRAIPFIVLFIFGSGLLWNCQRRVQPEDPAVWKKVHLNFKRIDSEGLAGSKGAKVAVNYEFCVPAEEKFWKKVQKTDRTARLLKDSAGRVGCGKNEWLVIGSTQQPQYQRVLYELASLPFVNRIEETFWE